MSTTPKLHDAPGKPTPSERSPFVGKASNKSDTDGGKSPPKKDSRSKVAPFGDVESARIVVRTARTRKMPGKGFLSRLDPLWSEGVNQAVDVGPGWSIAFLDWATPRNPERMDSIRLAIKHAEADDGNNPDDDEGPITIPVTPPFNLGIIGTSTFVEATYPREWLCKRVLVRGKPCVIGGPKKALKTSFVVDLVVSLAGAMRFLDQFDVPRRIKTLVISGESGEATIQETLRRVCRSKEIDPAELEGSAFWGFTLPQLGDPEHLAVMGEFIRSNGIECVIIDPLYLCLINGGRRIDPANLFDMGPLLKRICDLCLDAGATPLLVHHFRKNRDSPYGRPDMEDLAFAGTQEFARQWILLSRREAYEPGSGEHKLWLSVGGSDGHSGEWSVDVSEGVISEDFRDRDWRLTIATAAEAIGQVKQQTTAAKQLKIQEADRAKEHARERKVCDDAETALDVLSKAEGRKLTKNAWQGRLPTWNSARMNAALGLLANQKRIKVCETIVKGSKGREWSSPGWEFVTDVLQELTPDYPRLPQTLLQTFSFGLGLNQDEINPRLVGVLPPEGGEPKTSGVNSSGVGPGQGLDLSRESNPEKSLGLKPGGEA